MNRMYKTHNDKKNIKTCGTSYQGEVYTSYKKLFKLFGEPTSGDGYKVDAEWNVEFDDGKVATIYNWKDGKNYNGAEGMETENITDWHIGGFEKDVVDRIEIIVK